MDKQLEIHFTRTEEGELAPYKSTFGFNPIVKPYDGDTGSTTLPVWNTYEGMKFDGSYKIRGHQDVAYLMKSLESKSVELGFAVHVNDQQEAMIQFLSAGGRTGTIIDPTAVLAGSKIHNSKEIYLVHNHPSGNLKPSQADMAITRKIKEGFANLDINVSHIIMNTYQKAFTVILMDDSSAVPDSSIHLREESLIERKNYTAHTFDEMKILREPLGKVTGAKDVAEIIQQTRFSALPKNGVLVLSNNLAITGNFFVDDFSLKTITDLVGPLPSVRGIIAYGNTDQEKQMVDLRQQLKFLEYDLLDYVQVNSNANGVKGAYKSYADEGMLYETLEKYGTGQIKAPEAKREAKPWEGSEKPENPARGIAR